jgi:hypothetical protein
MIISEDERGRYKIQLKAKCLTFALILTVFLPLIWAQTDFSFLDKKQLEQIYAQGKSVFYSSLEKNSSFIPLTREDRIFLHKESSKKNGLFEHLMNFYYYLHDLCKKDENTFRTEFLKISATMAEEFIQSIPFPFQKKDYSSLKQPLISSGYYFKRTAPHFRKFIRPMGRKVKGQSVFKDLQVDQAHTLSKGENIRIAVIDSGIDPTIREIKGRINKYKNLLDGSNPLTEKGSFPFDWSVHGTAVTSLIHQIAPKAELLIVKFYDEDKMRTAPPTRWTAYLAAAGLIWAVRNGADIINLSAAFSQDLWPIREATKYCWEQNVIVITAMGNVFKQRDTSEAYYPAQYPWTIAVGGTEKSNGQLKVWEYSGCGEYIDIVAPAIDLWVDLPSYLQQKTEAKMLNGNSLAVALVSGAAALILDAMDKKSQKELFGRKGQLCEEVRKIFRTTASNDLLGFNLPNPFSGYGMIEIHKAVRLARNKKENKRPLDIFTTDKRPSLLIDAFSGKLSK